MFFIKYKNLFANDKTNKNLVKLQLNKQLVSKCDHEINCFGPHKIDVAILRELVAYSTLSNNRCWA